MSQADGEDYKYDKAFNTRHTCSWSLFL